MEMENDPMEKKRKFVSRDLSWLHFNERVLLEAANPNVPLLERFRFLSIFSSNLDEFYRVRMPAVLALGKIGKKEKKEKNLASAELVRETIERQQQKFGELFANLLPLLEQNNIFLNYAKPLPESVIPAVTEFFFTEVLAFIQPVCIDGGTQGFFPENNKLYFLVPAINPAGKKETWLINIPSTSLPRFFTVDDQSGQHIIILDDVIRHHLDSILRGHRIEGAYSFKITRDAELNLEDDYAGDLAALIEEQIAKRDFGLATRLLYDPRMPGECLDQLIKRFGLSGSIIVPGGVYHHLRDLSALPLKSPEFQYPVWTPVNRFNRDGKAWLLDALRDDDLILHAPYHCYDTVLQFFNEAAIDPGVEEIFVTLYRVADNSRIVNALISAAKNGKNVTVLVELKARFDEANNIKWARRLKSAGVNVVYSVPSLKVHAKIALIKKRDGDRNEYFGMLATGNMNEITARFYTDHILLTTRRSLLKEMEQLFRFLVKGKKPRPEDRLRFEELLVAQFNLQDEFLRLIDVEIDNAKKGLPAGIIIKMNNLEEKVMIRKLYDAAEAGVRVQLIIRGICCLDPDDFPQISVHRIVDRYLEHGRVFIFHNNGEERLYLGSADWMNRNIYRRVEVCFPVYDERIQEEIKKIISIQLADNVQATQLNGKGENVAVRADGPAVRSQEVIYKTVKESAYEVV